MKKLLLTMVLCLSVALVFGQKKAVSEVKREIGNANPNYQDAKSLISEAKVNPETKDNAETWFVAGKVEYRQFDLERTKETLELAPDFPEMYMSLINILPNFIVADSLDMLPNEKGKVKPKFRKDMKSIMLANRSSYIRGGAFFLDNKDFITAYKFFQQYIDIPNLNMFAGENLAANDTLYSQIKFYAAYSLFQIGGDSQRTIAAFQNIKNGGYLENDIYRILCAEYEQLNDTVNLVKTLKEGFEKFPNEQYYLLNLIDQYFYANQNDEAIAYLERAIAIRPNDAQLYDFLGKVYENKNDISNAQANFEKALSIDPDYVEAIGDLGRIFFNQAAEAQTAANEIADNKKYEAARSEANEMFKKSLPFFEQAHQMKPDDRSYMNVLSRIYYILNMGDKFDEIEKALGNQ